jgi:hypothetical protein
MLGRISPVRVSSRPTQEDRPSQRTRSWAAQLASPHSASFRLATLLAATAALLHAACGGERDSGTTAALAPDPDLPRVFFVGIADGDVVEGLIELEFGAENFRVEAVGEGFVHPGAGHFHLGIDTQCLPPETLIPTAAPWIHFSDGSNTIELQLTPGPHTLVLQAGNAEHRTLAGAGLCQSVHVVAKDSVE